MILIKECQQNTSSQLANFHIKVGLSHSKKKILFASRIALEKNDEKCFLFHLKSLFHFQDI